MSKNLSIYIYLDLSLLNKCYTYKLFDIFKFIIIN